MPEDRIIVSVLPFEKPRNKAEEEFNDLAMKYYLDVSARALEKSVTVFVPNPDHPSHVYVLTAGWTGEGWRTHTACMNRTQLFAFAEVVVDAEEKALRQMDRELREAGKN